MPPVQDPYWFRRKRACVVGLGKSGLAAARLLKSLGAAVSVSEHQPLGLSPLAARLPRGVSREFGGHRFLRRPWDLLVVSPGVPARVWRPLQNAGTPVWGEMELAYRVLSLSGRWPARTAAVTGTNGKTTTTALLGAIFRADGRRTFTAGNIGTPLSDLVGAIDRSSALALEISSYQLEAAPSFRPAAGALLNVTPDHLGRHGSMEGYARVKFNIFANQTASDGAVLNSEDPWCRRLAGLAPGRTYWFGLGASRGPGVYFRGGKIVSSLPGGEGRWDPPRRLPGRHNIQNALAAVGCARLLGAGRNAVAAALRDFPGVEHRLEEARVRAGVRFINDSKATNVDSTLMALRSFPGNLHLILGGEDKGAPYAPLRAEIRGKVREILLIGAAASKIAKELAGAAPLAPCGTLKRAVEAAAANARPGDVVLLSPACASFDQFENFEDRGRQFKDFVRDL